MDGGFGRLDGDSLLPIMTGQVEHVSRSDLFWFMPGYLPGRQTSANVIRLGDWKLHEFFEDERLELYNLREDIGETEEVAELHAKLKAWRQSTGAAVPPHNPDFDPANEGRI